MLGGVVRFPTNLPSPNPRARLKQDPHGPEGEALGGGRGGKARSQRARPSNPTKGRRPLPSPTVRTGTHVGASTRYVPSLYVVFIPPLPGTGGPGMNPVGAADLWVRPMRWGETQIRGGDREYGGGVKLQVQ